MIDYIQNYLILFLQDQLRSQSGAEVARSRPSSSSLSSGTRHHPHHQCEALLGRADWPTDRPAAVLTGRRHASRAGPYMNDCHCCPRLLLAQAIQAWGASLNC